MKINYEWLTTYFEDDTLPDAEELAQLLIFHAYEIEGVEAVGDTHVLDVDVLPNRASDSLSHRGVAREVATLLNIPLKEDPLSEPVALTPLTEGVTVTIDPDSSCSYYAAGYITGVTVGPSPEWLKKRLEAIGQKSINNVVDATNYVQFGLGKPTHVFDAQKFSGTQPTIGVRRAQEGEEITLLGGESATLSSEMSVIIDRESNEALAVAGIKGGVHAEVEAGTTDIIIESARFDPLQTRLTAQALKMRTDASARFENDVPDELSDYGVVEVVKLILDIAGGELKGFTSAGAVVPRNSPVTVTTAQTEALLGVSISGDEIESILTRLGFTVTREKELFTVVAPFERRDISIKEDVIEEIGRVYGYEKVPAVALPVLSDNVQTTKKFAYSERIKTLLMALGCVEVYLYSLRHEGEVPLLNSLASDKNFLRKNLSDGIVESLERNERNAPLLGMYEHISIFEVGNVFPKNGEHTSVCIGVRALGTKKKSERTQGLLMALKLHLEKELGVALPKPGAETLEWNLDEMIQNAPELDSYQEGACADSGIAYSPISTYPFMLRDVAMWVPEGVTPDEVLAIAVEHAGELLQRGDLFDEFTKDGRTSYAFHLVFQSTEKTLTDEEIGAVMKKIETHAQEKGWEVR